MKDFFRHNGILILIAAILLALVTAVVSMLFGGVADPLSNLVGIVTTPVRNGITAVTNWAEEKYNDAFELEQMKEELAGLKQRNAELEAQAREAEAALQENERLRNLLELQPKEWSCDKAAAMVTARSTSNWESTLTIGKGSAAGIAVDDCVVDEYWMDNIDAMQELRQGIGLRAYGQNDPVVAYKKEGYEMFESMIAAIQAETIRRIFLARVQVGATTVKRERVAKVTGESAGSDGTVKKQPVKKGQKVGRNDPCPCGSGKKYKKCCGRDAE